MFTAIDMFSQNRPLVMGILNITPDSFSDGGVYTDVDFAVARGLQILEEGGDIIDVGGESTRPYSDRVPAEMQIDRVIPVLKALRRKGTLSRKVAISVDTTIGSVADAAIAHGASLINDVSAGTEDPNMFSVAARNRVPIVLMHMQGTPSTMQDAPSYVDVVSEVVSFLQQRIAAALDAGIPEHHIIIDPGIGFGKTKTHNLCLLANMGRFVQLGYPVMLGTSRKRFMGSICQVDGPAELVGATVATTVMGVLAGVRLFRVHDVKPNRQAVDVTTCIRAFAC